MDGSRGRRSWAPLWMRRPGHTSSMISLINRINGALGISRSPVFWYFLISSKALTRTSCSRTGDQQSLNSCERFCSKDSSPAFQLAPGTRARGSGERKYRCFCDGEGCLASSQTRRDDGQLGLASEVRDITYKSVTVSNRLLLHEYKRLLPWALLQSAQLVLLGLRTLGRRLGPVPRVWEGLASVTTVTTVGCFPKHHVSIKSLKGNKGL
jgi:hypothetical protein